MVWPAFCAQQLSNWSDGTVLICRRGNWGCFLTCYLETEAQTVRGLAAKLGVSKPAITRALDRLSEFDLVRRKTDPLDRRSVLVQRTATGMAFLRELRTILRDAATAMRITAEPAPAGRQRAGSDVTGGDTLIQCGSEAVTMRVTATGGLSDARSSATHAVDIGPPRGGQGCPLRRTDARA